MKFDYIQLDVIVVVVYIHVIVCTDFFLEKSTHKVPSIYKCGFTQSQHLRSSLPLPDLAWRMRFNYYGVTLIILFGLICLDSGVILFGHCFNLSDVYIKNSLL